MGPRTSGQHQRVFDFFPAFGKLPAQCKCMDCGTEWPEGSETRPSECDPKQEAA